MNNPFILPLCPPRRILLRFFKNTAFVLFPLLFAMCIQDDPEVFTLKPGDPLPEFSVQDNKGEIVSNATLYNKVCVIAFVNTGCPDCRRELPELEKAYRQFVGDERVRFIVISRLQGYDSLTEYWIANSLTLPYSAQEDDFVFQKFASQNIPRIYIASPEGIIYYTADETDAATAEQLIEEIERALPFYPSY